MNIVLISASMNNPSNSDLLCDWFREGLEKTTPAVATQKIQLRELQIEQFTLDHYDPVCNQEEDFCNVQAAIESADGLVIASPVWNFGVPGNLKNLIDRFGSFALDETRSKGTLKGLPFYLLFTGGAPAPAWSGLMKKTTSFVAEAMQYFGASYIGHHFEPRCTRGRGQFGLVVDERPETRESIEKQATAFAAVVEEYKKTGKPPLKHSIKAKIMKWGERLLKKLG